MAKQRIGWLDIAKGIAIIAVVLGHSLPFESTVKHVIFSFHMPLFFICAGYTFRLKPWRSMAKTSAKRLLLPYALLFLIPMSTVMFYRTDVGVDFFVQYAKAFVFSSAIETRPVQAPPVGVIWFFVVLFLARLYLNGLIGLFDKRNVPMWGQFLAMLALGLVGIAVSKHAFLPASADLVPLAGFFMFLGYAVKKCDLVGILSKWSVVAIAFVVWVVSVKLSWFSFGDRMFDLLPFSILGACAGTLVVSKASMIVDSSDNPLATFLSFMGRNSMLVLCLHFVELLYIPWVSFPFFESLPVPHYGRFVAEMAFILITLAVFYMNPLSLAPKKDCEAGR